MVLSLEVKLSKKIIAMLAAVRNNFTKHRKEQETFTDEQLN